MWNPYDEEFCSNPVNGTCSNIEFTCGDGTCIPMDYYCDGSKDRGHDVSWVDDCPDGSDEVATECCG